MGRPSPLKNQRTSAGLGLLHIRCRVSRRSTSAVLFAMTTGWARISVGRETEGEGAGHCLLPWPPLSPGQERGWILVVSLYPQLKGKEWDRRQV